MREKKKTFTLQNADAPVSSFRIDRDQARVGLKSFFFTYAFHNNLLSMLYYLSIQKKKKKYNQKCRERALFKNQINSIKMKE